MKEEFKIQLEAGGTLWSLEELRDAVGRTSDVAYGTAKDMWQVIYDLMPDDITPIFPSLDECIEGMKRKYE